MPESPSVILRPLAWGIPKEAVPCGKTFTLQLSAQTEGDWPYPEDSFEIGVMAVGNGGLTVYFNDGSSFVVHRDPKQCTRLTLTVVAEATGSAEIVVNLITQGGIPFRSFAFDVTVAEPVTKRRPRLSIRSRCNLR